MGAQNLTLWPPAINPIVQPQSLCSGEYTCLVSTLFHGRDRNLCCLQMHSELLPLLKIQPVSDN